MTRLFTSAIAFLVLAMATAAQMQGPQSYNITVFGTLDPAAAFKLGRYSSLTGYAAPDGREYALLGGFTGTHIIDVTESPVREVSFIPGPLDGWREMKTYGQYAYVISEGGAGLQIIDLSNLPASATLVRSDTSYFRTAHTITREGSYLYVNGTGIPSGANGGTMIFDLSHDPTHPERIGMWTARYVHDCTIRNDTMYAAAVNDGKLDIVYLGADRKNPELVASIEYPGAGTHNSDLTPDGSYVMTTDEIGATAKTLKVWDVRDVDNIRKVTDWTPAPGEIIHNVHTKGTLAFISWYTAGTRIVDISNPASPAELGFYDSYDGAADKFDGNWEVYPYLPSGKILASDMHTGLHVFTFNGAVRGSVHGRVLDESTGLPVPGAVVEFPETGRRVTADNQGRYSFAGAAGTLQFTASSLDYSNHAGSLALKPEDNEADITIAPLSINTVLLRAVDGVSGNRIPGFVYRSVERPESAGTAGEEQAFRVPKDSTFHVYVGLWGYRSQMVELPRNHTGAYTLTLQPGYMDDAELDLGWVKGADDDATGGAWERGVPAGIQAFDDPIQPGADHTPGFGNKAYITGLGGAEIIGTVLSVGTSDVDNGTTTLILPPMDLSTYDDPFITCWLWYSRDVFATDDTLDVLISGNEGETWSTMARITRHMKDWTKYQFRVKDAIMPTNRMFFKIVASDLYQSSLVEAGMDDFMVTDGTPGSSSVPAAGTLSDMVKFRQLRPNPFAAAATLDLELARDQRNALLELFDEGGCRVALLHQGSMQAGAHSYPVDGASLPAGHYLWRLTLDDGRAVTGGATVVR